MKEVRNKIVIVLAIFVLSFLCSCKTRTKIYCVPERIKLFKHLSLNGSKKLNIYCKMNKTIVSKKLSNSLSDSLDIFILELSDSNLVVKKSIEYRVLIKHKNKKILFNPKSNMLRVKNKTYSNIVFPYSIRSMIDSLYIN